MPCQAFIKQGAGSAEQSTPVRITSCHRTIKKTTVLGSHFYWLGRQYDNGTFIGVVQAGDGVIKEGDAYLNHQTISAGPTIRT
jgi:hypothetical protein